MFVNKALELLFLFQFVLRKEWRQTLPEYEHRWVLKALSQEGKLWPELRQNIQLWWYPPQPPLVFSQPPSSPDVFFHRRLILRMPYRIWAFKLVCAQPQCAEHRLTSCGIYKQATQVLDVDGFYHLASEYLEYGECHKKYIGWSNAILKQVDVGHRSYFPAILTYNYFYCLFFKIIIGLNINKKSVYAQTE